MKYFVAVLGAVNMKKETTDNHEKNQVRFKYLLRTFERKISFVDKQRDAKKGSETECTGWPEGYSGNPIFVRSILYL